MRKKWGEIKGRSSTSSRSSRPGGEGQITGKLRPACHSDLRNMSQSLSRHSVTRLERQTVKNGRVVRSQRTDRRCFWKFSIPLTFPQTCQDRSVYLSPHRKQVVLYGPVLRRTVRCSQND